MGKKDDHDKEGLVVKNTDKVTPESLQSMVDKMGPELLQSMVDKMDPKLLQSIIVQAFDRLAKSYYEKDEHLEIIRKIAGEETSRMGKIAEFVAATTLPWIMERHFGVQIKKEDVFRRIPFKNPTSITPNTGRETDDEIDVLAVSENVVTVVEAKTTITAKDIYDFKNNIIDEFFNLKLNTANKRLKRLNGLELKGKQIYGGVAFFATSIHISENEIVQDIEGSGLFGVKIINESSVELCASGLDANFPDQV